MKGTLLSVTSVHALSESQCNKVSTDYCRNDTVIVVIIILIIVIIIFIYCNWVVTRWQWLFYMYTKHEIGYY